MKLKKYDKWVLTEEKGDIFLDCLIRYEGVCKGKSRTACHDLSESVAKYLDRHFPIKKATDEEKAEIWARYEDTPKLGALKEKLTAK